jgi:rhodanese-related sulfurtransferase
MTMRSISPQEAKRLIEAGAVLVDIREADEQARERIPGARHVPLSRLDDTGLAAPEGRTVIFHCRSGARTKAQGARLAAKAGNDCEALLIEGGLDAWRKAGLPTIVDRSQPIDMQRQVQIGAGAIVLIGTLLGLIVSPWFFVIPLFAGTGLLFAGLTGFCGMALLLQRAPWNQTAHITP